MVLLGKRLDVMLHLPPMISTLMDIRLSGARRKSRRDMGRRAGLILSFGKIEAPGRNVDPIQLGVDGRRKAGIDYLVFIHVVVSSVCLPSARHGT
jgi:hypothetical protein